MTVGSEILPPLSKHHNSLPSRASSVNGPEVEKEDGKPAKWSMGMLNDRESHEVPGSVLLLTGRRNESLPLTSSTQCVRDKKLAKDGSIILDPQPDDSHNDPLNWPIWRRDSALLSLGLFCMVGGGMTPILAAEFNNVAETFGVETAQVSLSTGLYMVGLGVGAAIISPTAILFGKRPVYLLGALMFTISAIWCALSPNFVSLLVARIFQGITICPTECLPSSTISETFFLHERAYRIGIYTLLLLGGKNLVPLVSAAITQSLGWRWIFWIVAMIGCVCAFLLFLFVHETFWDRTPGPKSQSQCRCASEMTVARHSKEPRKSRSVSGHRAANLSGGIRDNIEANLAPPAELAVTRNSSFHRQTLALQEADVVGNEKLNTASPILHGCRLSFEHDIERIKSPDFRRKQGRSAYASSEKPTPERYTMDLRQAPKKTFVQQLRPYNGRLDGSTWLRVAIRPFILFLYPAVLWSSMVYACSVGWLIVLSESVAIIYRARDTYNFSALSTGLVYLSPFIGGVLGTVVAGKIGDIIVRAISRRNGGLYEPEFRLIMIAPVAVTTVIGLIGFGWSAQIHDSWIVPTIFFGIISFGCSLGSTTAITFCVDSYCQHASEALVTLNFSKNILHGLVFSLFFTSWLERDGSKTVFTWLGVIQLLLIAFSVPMYVFGKRARMRTVRLNLMEKF